MNIRWLLASFLLTLMGGLILAQINYVNVQASANPITYPITTPISYFTLSGRVGYIVWPRIVPAKNVKIQAVNTQTNQNTTTLTNSQGRYNIQVVPGQYRITASDSRGSRFNPSEYLIDVISANLNNLNFIAKLR